MPDVAPLPEPLPPHAPGSIPSDIFCVTCDYNLRGLTGERCPECGRPLGALRTGVSEIPWVRREGGVFRAWLRTVWWVSRHPNRLADEVLLRFDILEARKFRDLTTVLAWIPLAIVATASGLRWLPERFVGDREGHLVWSVAWATATVGMLPVLQAMQSFIAAHYRTDTLTAERAGCFRALSLYAGAVRVWIVLPALLPAATAWVPDRADWLKPLFWGAPFMTTFPLMAWLETILRIPAQRLAGKRAYRRTAFVTFAVGWPLTLFAALVVAPAIAAYLTGLTLLLLN